MPTLPGPIRAAIGLAAIVVDEVRSLPEHAIELPMLAVSTALQMSLRAQQRYAQLTAKGDDLLSGRATTDEPPGWATFDPPVDIAERARQRDADAAPPRASVDESDESDVDLDPADPAGATTTDDTVDVPNAKSVRAPRDGAPSRFDAVGDQP